MIQKYAPQIPKKNKKPNVALSSNSVFSSQNKKKKKEVTDLLGYYKAANEEAEENYKKAGEALSKNTEEKLRRAAVNYELLKKYLPIENERAGLSGLGVSESAGIEARNGYARRVGEIESTHDEKQAKLDAAYQNEKTELAERYAKSQTLALEEEKSVRAVQDSAYQSALDIIKNEEFNSFEELDGLLAKVKPHVRDEQYETLSYYVEYYKRHPDFAER